MSDFHRRILKSFSLSSSYASFNTTILHSFSHTSQLPSDDHQHHVYSEMFPRSVDGVFSNWTAWSDCSVSCGGGLANRSRDCDGPFYGGKNCQGPWEEQKVCNDQPCPGLCTVFQDYSGVLKTLFLKWVYKRNVLIIFLSNYLLCAFFEIH